MLKLLKELVALVMVIIEVLLVFRFVLKLLAANPRADLVMWIYTTSEPLLKPFLAVFPAPSVRGEFVLEFSTLCAIFAYAILGYLVQEVLELFIKKP